MEVSCRKHHLEVAGDADHGFLEETTSMHLRLLVKLVKFVQETASKSNVACSKRMVKDVL